MEGQEWIREIRLIKGFVFKSVFGQRPDLCKRLLEIILEIEIEEISIVQPEREMDVLDKRRGGRVDLLIVDDKGNRYDVEVQTTLRNNEWLRARYYQSLMDANQLKRGAKISELRDSIVVFVCDFDPFGKGLCRYDCATVCLQTKEIVPDQRSSVYLNVRGVLDELPQELKNIMLLFMGEVVDNDDFVSEIIAEMKRCVDNPEWMDRYMTLEEEIEAEKDAARKEGREEGLKEGREEGRKEGREEGRKEGHREGFKEGREQALKEGRRAIFEQNARLVRALEEAGRLDMLGDAMSDPQVYEGMLKEFGIEH